MKVLSVTYAMLRTTQRYENDRCEVTVEVGARTQEAVDEAVAEAKRQCAKALGKPDPVTGVELSDVVRVIGQAGPRGISQGDVEHKLGVDRSCTAANKARAVLDEAIRLKLIKRISSCGYGYRFYPIWVEPPSSWSEPF